MSDRNAIIWTKRAKRPRWIRYSAELSDQQKTTLQYLKDAADLSLDDFAQSHPLIAREIERYGLPQGWLPYGFGLRKDTVQFLVGMGYAEEREFECEIAFNYVRSKFNGAKAAFHITGRGRVALDAR